MFSVVREGNIERHLRSEREMKLWWSQNIPMLSFSWLYEKWNIQNKWYLKYDHNKYADINSIWTFLGPKICLALPAVHGATQHHTSLRCGKQRKGKSSWKRLAHGSWKYQSITEEIEQNAKKFLVRYVLHRKAERNIASNQNSFVQRNGIEVVDVSPTWSWFCCTCHKASPLSSLFLASVYWNK